MEGDTVVLLVWLVVIQLILTVWMVSMWILGYWAGRKDKIYGVLEDGRVEKRHQGHRDS